jgi:hypothetical protein
LVPPDAAWSEKLKVVGGLVALLVALGVVLTVALVAISLLSGDGQSIVSIATAAFGVIGSLAGAYYGVKVGSDGTQNAIEALQKQAAHAQALAAYVPPDQSRAALSDAQRLASGQPLEPPFSSQS